VQRKKKLNGGGLLGLCFQVSLGLKLQANAASSKKRLLMGVSTQRHV
jgi:hypothetical protein